MFGASAMIGFGQGFQPVCGFNYGAGLYSRVRKGFWFCVKVSTVALLAIAALGYGFAPKLVALFRERDKADFNPKEFHILHTLKDALERKFYDLLAEPAAGVLPAERLRQAAAGYGLTKRETEIAELVCRNLSTEEICEKLYLAPATLSKHLSNIYGKVKVTGRIALMALLTGTANKA